MGISIEEAKSLEAIAADRERLTRKFLGQRVAPAVAAQHTMRAQAILSLGDTTKHQAMALQHLEAAFVAAHPGWRA